MTGSLHALAICCVGLTIIAPAAVAQADANPNEFLRLLPSHETDENPLSLEKLMPVD